MHPNITIQETKPTRDVLDALIALSKLWEAENSCFGYRANTDADILGNRIFTARDGDAIVGYAFGHAETAKTVSSVLPEGTTFFELEELYVRPEVRNNGIGLALLQAVEESVRSETDRLFLSTATKDAPTIMRFYLNKAGMTFWSARLFKRLDCPSQTDATGDSETVDADRIRSDVETAFAELLRAAKPQPGALLVLGCSTSEIIGKQIGSASSEAAASAVMDALLPLCSQNGLSLAVQGCEHINRALCTDRETAQRLGLSEVAVEPWLHAGGACVTEAKRRIQNAIMVEDVGSKATLGMDVGDTLIGMHLRPVVVPVHTTCKTVGRANLVLAYSRPKYIGGPRAHYTCF